MHRIDLMNRERAMAVLMDFWTHYVAWRKNFMHRIDPMNREPATAILMDFRHTILRFQEKKNILGPLPSVFLFF